MSGNKGVDAANREAALRDVIAGARCILWEARVTAQGDGFAWKLQILSPEETRREFGFSRSSQSNGTEANDNEVYVQHLAPEDLERMNEISGRALRNGAKGYHQELRLRDAAGNLRYMSEDVRIIPVQPGVFNLIGVQVDVTERKRAEAALWRAEEHLRQAQKLEAIAHFAAGTANYFNNLMLVIDNYSEHLRKSMAATDPRCKDVAMIQKAIQLASEMNRRLLAFGHKPMSLKPVNLNALIVEMDRMLRPMIGNQIEFTAILDPELHLVRADPAHFEQAIVNLTLNARDAMPQGGKLVIETLNIDVNEQCAAEDIELIPGPYVLIVVSDTGYGMDAEIVTHLFEPFFTTKGIAKGAGLGLATVYAIIRRSGGNVQVSSESGKGTRFKIYLPAVASVEEKKKDLEEVHAL